MQEEDQTGPAATDSSTVTLKSQTIDYRPSNNAIKRVKKMQKQYLNMFDQQRKDNARLRKQETVIFKTFKKQVGNELYASLKKSSIVTTPAVMNEDGTVKTAATEVLDQSLFMRQLKLAAVVLKEGRIRDGKRSKNTGRSSDRAEQKSNIEAIMNAISSRMVQEQVPVEPESN